VQGRRLTAQPRPLRETVKEAWAGWPGTALRILIALVPLGWLLRAIDLRRTFMHVLDVRLSFLGALAVSIASLLISSERWRRLLQAYGAQAAGVWTLFRHHLVGCYFNLLPSGLAGDAVRGYRTVDTAGGMAISYTVVLVDRAAGLLGLLLVALAAMPLVRTVDTRVVMRVVDLGLVAVALFVVAFMLLPYWTRRWPRLAAAIGRVPLLGRAALKIPAARRISGLLVAVALSLVTQLCGVFSSYLLARRISRTATMLACLRIMPFVYLLAYFPITPAGIGQRELLYVYFWGTVGMGAEEAVALSLASFAIGVIYAVSGGLLCLLEGRSRRARA
jgi:glycosyltransferase 2 family protein